MSNILEFEELLRSDENLQTKLNEAIEAFDGDRADEVGYFDATVGKVAEEAGLPFSYDEAKVFTLDEVGLDDDELDAVVAGSACYFAGGGDTTRACESVSEGLGAGACRCIGVGFFGWK